MKTYCPECDAQTERVLLMTVRIPIGWGRDWPSLEEATEAAIGLGKYGIETDTFWNTSCDVCGEKYSEAWRNGYEDYGRHGDVLSLGEVWEARGGKPITSADTWPRWEIEDFDEYTDGWRIGIADRDENLMGWDI